MWGGVEGTDPSTGSCSHGKVSARQGTRRLWRILFVLPFSFPLMGAYSERDVVPEQRQGTPEALSSADEVVQHFLGSDTETL